MIALVAAAWLAATPAAALPAAPRAQVQRFDDGTRTDLELDGPILGWRLVRGPEGARRLFVLAGPPEKKAESACGVASAAGGPARRDAHLFAWDPARPETLSRVGEGLPEGSLETVDLDGNGAEELLVFGEAGIEELVVDREAGTTLAREIVAGRFAPAGAETPDDPDLRALSLGALTTYRRRPDGALRPVAEVELPLRVDRWAGSIHVQTFALRSVGRLADGRVRFTGPITRHGVERVSMLVVDPDGPDDARVVEAWGRLPGRERSLEHAVVRLDGRPVLVVLTTDADKLSLFGEKRLRIFPLQADRTRAGLPPLLAVDTKINLWQGAIPTVLDLDADGREDLVLAYWKGLKDTIAALELRRRLPDGGFAAAKTFDFDVPDGERGVIAFGEDLDGDGRPDLALRVGGALTVYAGAPAEAAIERPVGKVPARRIPLPAGAVSGDGASLTFSSSGLSVERAAGAPGWPVFADVDGDGRSEAVLADASESGGRLVIVRFR